MDEDRKSYPTTAEAAGQDAMSSFRSVLDHSIDIQVCISSNPDRNQSEKFAVAGPLDHLLYAFRDGTTIFANA